MITVKVIKWMELLMLAAAFAGIAAHGKGAVSQSVGAEYGKSYAVLIQRGDITALVMFEDKRNYKRIIETGNDSLRAITIVTAGGQSQVTVRDKRTLVLVGKDGAISTYHPDELFDAVVAQAKGGVVDPAFLVQSLKSQRAKN